MKDKLQELIVELEQRTNHLWKRSEESWGREDRLIYREMAGELERWIPKLQALLTEAEHTVIDPTFQPPPEDWYTER